MMIPSMTQDNHAPTASIQRALFRTPFRTLTGVATVAVAAWLVLQLTGCGTTARTGPAAAAVAAPDPLTPDQRAKYDESFDVVWNTIRDTHWDPKLNGADWDGARAELKPKIQTAQTADEARGVINSLIARLGQSHYGVFPSDTFVKPPVGETSADGAAATAANTSETKPAQTAKSDDDDFTIVGEGTLGIEVRVLDGKVHVFRVDNPSPAMDAGIVPGTILHAADGTDLTQRAAKLAKGGASALVTHRVIEHDLSGDVGDTIALDYALPGQRRQTKTLTLAKPTGADGSLGNLTGVRMRYTARTLDATAMGLASQPATVEYVGFNMFAAPGEFAKQFEQSIQRARSARGLIIDLRGNPGGIGAMAMGIGGWFNEKPNTRLGTMTTRTGTINFILTRRAEPFKAPVAILIDGGSASTSEILAGGLQDLGLARVFGTQSAGAALPSVISKLPSGDRFQYAIANYVSVGGEALEGRGVTPDEVVELDGPSLRRGRDPQIEAAIRWILSPQRANAGG